MITAALVALYTLPLFGSPEGEVILRSPGLTPSQVDAQGRLGEDWGTLQLKLAGDDFGVPVKLTVSPFILEGIVPGARVFWLEGPLTAELTAFRAPVWPAGIDVLTLRLQDIEERTSRGSVVVELPEGARVRGRSVTVGSRRVVILPDVPHVEQALRDWGHLDEASDLPGWARPTDGHDPAFANIRAGMGGVPIIYRFGVEPGTERTVFLGFCESYWSSPGSRLMTCKVEGAPAEIVDPLARWGQHQPGGLAFEGSDADGDGTLAVVIMPAPGTPDRNPILNAVWLFEPEVEVRPDLVIAGQLNGAAERFVDVGGERDQSILPGGRAELPFVLTKTGSVELVFLVACPGASLSPPDEIAWTRERLRNAAREVWEDWAEEQDR